MTQKSEDKPLSEKTIFSDIHSLKKGKLERTPLFLKEDVQASFKKILERIDEWITNNIKNGRSTLELIKVKEIITAELGEEKI